MYRKKEKPKLPDNWDDDDWDEGDTAPWFQPDLDDDDDDDDKYDDDDDDDDDD